MQCWTVSNRFYEIEESQSCHAEDFVEDRSDRVQVRF
jgi:hypothetical protein